MASGDIFAACCATKSSSKVVGILWLYHDIMIGRCAIMPGTGWMWLAVEKEDLKRIEV